MEKMVQKTLKKFTKIDILANDTGINWEAPAEIFSKEDWNEEVIDINLKGFFLCSQAVGKVMIKKKVRENY